MQVSAAPRAYHPIASASQSIKQTHLKAPRDLKLGKAPRRISRSVATKLIDKRAIAPDLTDYDRLSLETTVKIANRVSRYLAATGKRMQALHEMKGELSEHELGELADVTSKKSSRARQVNVARLSARQKTYLKLATEVKIANDSAQLCALGEKRAQRAQPPAPRPAPVRYVKWEPSLMMAILGHFSSKPAPGNIVHPVQINSSRQLVQMQVENIVQAALHPAPLIPMLPSLVLASPDLQQLARTGVTPTISDLYTLHGVRLKEQEHQLKALTPDILLAVASNLKQMSNGWQSILNWFMHSTHFQPEKATNVPRMDLSL